MVVTRTDICEKCGATFITTAKRRKVCDSCVRARHKAKVTQWYRDFGYDYHKRRRVETNLGQNYRDPVPGWANCPLCGQRWWSPDHVYVKYHAQCRVRARTGGIEESAYGVLLI